MNRRELMLLLGGALTAPRTLCAQEPGRVYRLGMMIRNPREKCLLCPALFEGLRQSGFVEGQNLRVEDGFSIRDEDASEVANALVASGVDAILTGSNHRTRVAQKATRTIPIVTVADDLVLSGLVSSLAHPGGNTTGISILATELDGKRQDLLIELVRTARRIAALADPSTAPEQLQALKDAARARGIELSIRIVSTPEEIVAAIDAAKGWGAQALNVLASGLLNVNQKLVIERAGMFRLPAIYQWPEIAEAGGLAAYGPRFTEIYRQQVARQLVKIFRGAIPADIPVEQPTRFELVINLNTAKALGLTIPLSILMRADEVIE